MTSYYVNNNAQPNGDHEVHTLSCTYLPTERTYLGEHAECSTAVAQAKQYYSQSNGCYTCSRSCHTS